METKFKIGGVILIFVFMTLSQVVSTKKTKDVLFFNVEALASGENGGSFCIGRGSVVCFNGDKVYFVY